MCSGSNITQLPPTLELMNTELSVNIMKQNVHSTMTWVAWQKFYFRIEGHSDPLFSFKLIEKIFSSISRRVNVTTI